jgi:hypothetical protein
MNSTFFHDGYRDALAGLPYSPPDVSVYAREYSEGYAEAEGDQYADSRESTDRRAW